MAESEIQIESNEFGKIKFKIKNEEAILSDWKKIIDLQAFLNEFIDYTEYWNQYIYYYNNYSKEKIKLKLNAQEYNRPNDYSVGENFALFTNDSISNSKYVDNNKAAKKIKKLYEKKFGKNHSLEFDPEAGFCYVYTKNRKEAEKFLWWAYTDIIKPVLDKIQH